MTKAKSPAPGREQGLKKLSATANGDGFKPTQFPLYVKNLLAIAALRLTFILRGLGL